MTAIAIPKELTKGEELVVMPKKLYEKFLSLIENRSGISSQHVKLDKRLLEALDDVKAGRILGPFTTLEEGLRVLKETK